MKFLAAVLIAGAAAGQQAFDPEPLYAVDVDASVELGAIPAVHGVNGGPILGDFATSDDRNSWDTYFQSAVTGGWRRIGFVRRADFVSAGPGINRFIDCAIPEAREHDTEVGNMHRMWLPCVGSQDFEFTANTLPHPGLHFWDSVEPAYAGEDPWDDTNYAYDRGIVEFLQHVGSSSGGARPILRLGGSHQAIDLGGQTFWATGAGSPPDDYDVFATVCRRLLVELSQTPGAAPLDLVEVWNEPYLSDWWNRNGVSDMQAGADYARLFEAVQDEIGLEPALGHLRLVAHFPADLTPGTPVDDWRQGFLQYVDQNNVSVDLVAPHFYVAFAFQAQDRIDEVRRQFETYSLPVPGQVVSEWNRNGSFVHGAAAVPFAANMLKVLADNAGGDVECAQFYSARAALWTVENDPEAHLLGAGHEVNAPKSPGLLWKVYGKHLYQQTPRRIQVEGDHLAAALSGGFREVTAIGGLSTSGDALHLVVSSYVADPSGAPLPQYARSGDKHGIDLRLTGLPFTGTIRIERFRETDSPDFTPGASPLGATLVSVETVTVPVLPGGRARVRLRHVLDNAYELIRITQG